MFIPVSADAFMRVISVCGLARCVPHAMPQGIRFGTPRQKVMSAPAMNVARGIGNPA